MDLFIFWSEQSQKVLTWKTCKNKKLRIDISGYRLEKKVSRWTALLHIYSKQDILFLGAGKKMSFHRA